MTDIKQPTTSVSANIDPGTRLIAYYLPQFHPIPENDAWWGKGFTEWTNVAKAVPYFPGHHQPQLPADLGFYDLRLPETREAQARLASEYGIYGFCYYYYWFAGRRILERPLQEVFESGKPDFPFCICWANETWSRRWDGSENEVLLQQVHNLANDEAFILDVIPLLKDPRYIRVADAPIILIYRLTLMDDPRRTIERWREICREHGIDRIHVCGVESFDIVDATQYGCDASVGFPPHRIQTRPINSDVPGLVADFTGQIMDYRDVVRRELSKPVPAHRLYPGVMVAWDNSPRRGKAGKIYAKATPDEYEHWLTGAILNAHDTLPSGERLVFINAWNEWAEGAHLEPDTRNGHGYLDATRHALAQFADTAHGYMRIRVMIRQYLANLAYGVWRKGHALGKWELRGIVEGLAARGKGGPRFHIAVILPLDKIEFVLATLESLENQLYTDGWGISLIADIPEPAGLESLSMLRWVERGERSPLQAVNDELVSSGADWVGMLEAGDALPVHAMFALSTAILKHPEWGMVYPDEDLLDRHGNRSDAYFKPDFSIDLVRGAPFSIGGGAFYRRELFEHIGGFDLDMEGIEYWEIALRMHERLGDNGIGHLPDILYHRFDGGGHCPRSADELDTARQRGLAGHLTRVGLSADIGEGMLPGTFHIRYRHTDSPLVTVIIPTKDQPAMIRRCIESLLAKTRYTDYEILIVDNGTQDQEAKDFLAQVVAHPHIRVLNYPSPYNYSAMNNLAAREARGEYLLLLNNDTAVVQEDWLDEMLAHGQRSDVGVVGARLCYPDGRLQHAGIVLGLNRLPADHPYIGLHPDDPGYFGRAGLAQNISAVTGACLLIRADLYAQLGGLDETRFGVAYNDVDLCLRVWQHGLRVVWTPFATLMHEGSASQREGTEGTGSHARESRFAKEADAAYAAWGERVAFDPWFNRNLRLSDRNVAIETRAAMTWDPNNRPRPRILAHPADTQGSGEYRILAPARTLELAGKVHALATTQFQSVPELFRMQPDTIILQRPSLDNHLRALEDVYARHVSAFKVYELDDLITNIPLSSGVKFRGISHKDLQRNFHRAIDLCDRLVVSTDYLAEQYRKSAREVHVVPNYLPSATWLNLHPVRRGARKARVGWAGGGGHAGDLAIIVDVVKATADEVDWVFLGMCPSAIRQHVRAYIPGVPLEDYPATLASLDLDLAVAPLDDVPFNHAKSHLRLLEYGILGYPVIATDITPYRGAYPIARVRNRFKDWVDAIREHVSDRDDLARRGDALREHILSNWMLDDHYDIWMKAWLP